MPATTVEQAVASSCTTTSVKGLATQVVAMMNCLHEGAMAEVYDGGNLTFGAAVFPYLQAPARDALYAALADKPSSTLSINSMFRTVVQQYLLYRWYQAGTCGIGLAAKPGSSNHETGLALDTSDYVVWKSTLQAHAFAWLGSSDAVHFDYVGSGIVDLGGEDVRAFQTLWNQNHPEDLIDEDGLYGPQTAARIQASPADGFPGAVVCPGGGPVDPPDAGPAPDLSEPDAGPVDPGPVDAGPADVGPADVGPGDAGPWAEPDSFVEDAGGSEPPDTAATDDLGGVDAGAPADAGSDGDAEPAGDAGSTAPDVTDGPDGGIAVPTTDVAFGGGGNGISPLLPSASSNSGCSAAATTSSSSSWWTGLVLCAVGLAAGRRRVRRQFSRHSGRNSSAAS